MAIKHKKMNCLPGCVVFCEIITSMSPTDNPDLPLVCIPLGVFFVYANIC